MDDDRLNASHALAEAGVILFGLGLGGALIALALVAMVFVCSGLMEAIR